MICHLTTIASLPTCSGEDGWLTDAAANALSAAAYMVGESKFALQFETFK